MLFRWTGLKKVASYLHFWLENSRQTPKMPHQHSNSTLHHVIFLCTQFAKRTASHQPQNQQSVKVHHQAVHHHFCFQMLWQSIFASLILTQHLGYSIISNCQASCNSTLSFVVLSNYKQHGPRFSKCLCYHHFSNMIPIAVITGDL